jgi:hypothetical protein
MSPTVLKAATALVAVALAGPSLSCGHKGDPLPPLRRTPPGLAEFRLAQRGASLEISLLTPVASVDGVPFERLIVEILYAEGDRDIERAGTRRERVALPRERVVETLPLPAAGTTARAAARAVFGRERGQRTLTMGLVAQAEVAPPRALRARLVEGGVRLDWEGEGPKSVEAAVRPPRPLVPLPFSGPRPPGAPVPATTAPSAPPTAPPAPAPPAPAPPAARPEPSEANPASPGATGAVTVELRKAGFRIYRRLGTERDAFPLTQEPLAGHRTTDAAAPEGREACYVVRAVASVDPLVESAASNEVCVEVRDVAPPAAPAGLAVLPRERGLEVLWTPSSEEDLAGYRVFREAAGEPRRLLAQLEAGRSAFLDAEARPGVSYKYSVAAFDRAGNESPAAPAAEASLP